MQSDIELQIERYARNHVNPLRWYLRLEHGGLILVKTRRPSLNDPPVPNPAPLLRALREVHFPLGIQFELR